MFRRSTEWLRQQWEPQGRHDQDQRHWWQLPDDETLTSSPWRQLVVDLASPATFSPWHRKVVESRVKKYDRLRPAVTRALALSTLAVGIAVVGAPWWVWLMLVPALTQVALELSTHSYLPESAPEPGLRIIALTRDVFRKSFGRLMFNVTGAIGALACPLNVLAAAWANPGADLGWVKVGALAAAIFYLNSGLGSAFLDSPNYSESSRTPNWLHGLRPFVPLLSLTIVVAIVALSVGMGRWEPALVPIAYLCTGLTLLLGSTIRNHDRLIAAAVPVARDAIEDGREDLGRMMHDQVGPIKAAAEGAAQIDVVPAKWRALLASLPALLTHFHTRTGIFDSERMDLPYLAERVLEPYGIWEHLSVELSWGELSKADHQTAVTMATALLHNAGQRLSDTTAAGCSKDLVLQGYTTGSGTGKFHHLALLDHLPPIADWCPAGRSMDELRTLLRTEHDGDLTQEILGEDAKRIVATWADVSIPDGYGDPLDDPWRRTR